MKNHLGYWTRQLSAIKNASVLFKSLISGMESFIHQVNERELREKRQASQWVFHLDNNEDSS